MEAASDAWAFIYQRYLHSINIRTLVRTKRYLYREHALISRFHWPARPANGYGVRAHPSLQRDLVRLQSYRMHAAIGAASSMTTQELDVGVLAGRSWSVEMICWGSPRV